ncbi:hypothetical protein [Streptomyces chattanoogensis]|uniref:hypothetical protein n=1 Tax=Streptomyces chattanoogensis TaxID=66876 RepID=UPI003692AB27
MTVMGKGSTKGEVRHFQTLDDGRTGCCNCDKPATRWIDMERYGIRRWLSTAYCNDHGDWQLNAPHHTHRERPIKKDDNK